MDHIAQVHKRGQIRPSSGPWASNPVLPVLVVQNGKIRFCFDYRRLNKVTRRDEHGLGNMDDLMQKPRPPGSSRPLTLRKDTTRYP